MRIRFDRPDGIGLTNDCAACPKGEIMTTRTQVLIGMAIASVLAAPTTWLLLDINVSIAVWMAGPYFLLVFLLPKSADVLATSVIVIAVYYFLSSLIALKYFSRRTLILVASIVIVVNSLGAYQFHRLSGRSANADGRAAQHVVQTDSACNSLHPGACNPLTSLLAFGPKPRHRYG
jgi:hypothetical protein